MIPTFLRKAHAFSRLLIVRVILIALLSVVAIGMAKLFGGFIPDGLEGIVGAGAVDRILSIIANSMLTVTTFSLTVMAATHRSVAGLWTPRAHQILLQDTTTHTVLATFVGAYLYALNAIILREADAFRDKELVVLFGMTLLVALLILIAIVRWIRHLEMFGSLIETAQRIEEQTMNAWRMRMQSPALGCCVLRDHAMPDGGIVFRARETGYVQQIYQDLLQQAAQKADAHIWIGAAIGAFVHKGDVIAQADQDPGNLADAIHQNIAIGTLRNYTQDPGFGLLNLSEIASRALSPGVNDPGTAIDCLRRMGRVMLDAEPATPDAPIFDRLSMLDFDRATALNRSYEPILRDGAENREVLLALESDLAALAGHPDAEVKQTASALLNRARNGIRALDQSQALG